MKKLLLVCCIVLGVSTLSRAQGGGGGGRPQMSPADQAARLKTTLTLTDDQTAKVTAIYAAQAKSTDSLRAAGNTDRAAAMPIRAAANAKIKAILTPDQQAAFDKMAQGRRGGGGGGGGAMGGGTPPPPQR
jgi:protein CpxP